MPKNTTPTLSTSTLKQILILIQDIPTSKLINELKSPENSTTSNRSKRDITSALRTLSELKNYTKDTFTESNTEECRRLISLFIQQAKEYNLINVIDNSQISDLYNYIQQGKKITEILTNEYLKTLHDYTIEVKKFHDNHYKTQKEFQNHLDSMKKDFDETLLHQADIKKLDDTVKQINLEQDDDLDDDWENDITPKPTIPLAITQITSLQKEVTALEKLKKHFKANFIQFQLKIKQFFHKLNKTEKLIEEQYATNPNESNLDELRSKRESLITETEREYTEIDSEVKAMHNKGKSPFLSDISNSIKIAQKFIDEVEIKSLSLNLYQNVNQHLFSEIKKDILNSAEFRALQQFKPKHSAKANLIKYYLQDIASTHNLEELIKATQADDYDPKAKISMRQNTNLSALIMNFFYYDDDSETNVLATALERKLSNIINTQKQLFHDMYRISTPKSTN